jgi:hypothetical protein
MGFAQSKLVPIAFWVAFVALGLFTSLGSPQKPHAAAKGARHSFLNLANPASPANASDPARAGAWLRGAGFQSGAARQD